MIANGVGANNPVAAILTADGKLIFRYGCLTFEEVKEFVGTPVPLTYLHWFAV
jgi:hypothetical protein